MAETIQDKLKSYTTAPFDARFPNTNQTRNCFQNYLGEDFDTLINAFIIWFCLSQYKKCITLRVILLPVSFEYSFM